MDNIKIAYAGYCIDEAELMKSSSGGAASSLSKWMIRNGGVVYGVTYSADFYYAHYERATRECELDMFRGSKYCYARKRIESIDEKKTVYESVADDLLLGKSVLFIGLGCDIASVKEGVERHNIDTKKLYLVELICDGVTDGLIQEEYVKWLENKYKAKIINFTVRCKDQGWENPSIKAEFDNGNCIVYPFYESDYGYAFMNYKRKNCYACSLRGENHLGDLIVGDYWGCNDSMNIYNANGVSIIILRNSKGGILLKYLDKDSFILKETDIDYAMSHNPRFYTPPKGNKRWDEFQNVLKDRGLNEAVRKGRNEESKKVRIRKTI